MGLLALAIATLAGTSTAFAQDPLVAIGAELFEARCASCHGPAGRSVGGHDLTVIRASGWSDARIFDAIRRGVPGTEMPGSTAPDGEVHALVAYIRSISVPAAPSTASRLPRSLPEISPADLLAGFGSPSRWLTYSGDYTGTRHSPLTQITPANVSRLAAQWTFQIESGAVGRAFESTPIVIDGVLFVTGANGYAWALDARTGRVLWRHRRELPEGLTSGALYPVNRGFAVLGRQLYMVTLDARLLALDATNGLVNWEVPLEDYRRGYSSTPAPLVVKDKVIVGSSGGEFPTRGFIAAYKADTGEQVWRFHTIPEPGAPGSETWPSADAMANGGGAAWVTGSYDPESNLVFWGTGNPSPDYYGDDRKGDNLYTCAIVALDADTGELRWHYQFTPHDTHDWDSNHIPVLADLRIAGEHRKVVMVANRNGFFYTLDRTTGTVLVARPFIETSWAREIGADGRPIVLNETGATECLPDFHGATNFMPPSYDPVRRLFFVTARETCVLYVRVRTDVPAHWARRSGSVSGTRFAVAGFLWPGPFPPSPPQPVPRPCSETSQVLRVCPTSRGRSSSASVLRLPDATRGTSCRGRPRDLPVPARGVPYVHGVSDRAGPDASRDIDAPGGAFRFLLQRRRPGGIFFRG
jgi:alcohol dehydrogenase (cytochrome c)